MPEELKYMLFGRYLCNKGLITFDDIISARSLQNEHNSRLGALARERGWLTDREVEAILVAQEENYRKFGEIAVEEGYLTEAQVEALLRHQKENHLLFGEALVRLGVLSEQVMIENLRAFIEVEKQLRKAVGKKAVKKTGRKPRR
jgi:hypothetical protein